MKTFASRWPAILCVAGAVLAHSQTLPMVKPVPDFTLTIRQVGYGGTIPANYAVLVRERNISDREIRGGGCSALETGSTSS